MRQMWCLMGRSVGTYLLITHWELLISLDACLVIVFIWETDMLIDYLACLSIVTLILPWLFCSPRMYRLIVVYHLTWCVVFLDHILSWSFLSMLSLSLFVLIVIFLFSSCVDMDDIFVLCLTVCYMTVLILYDCMSLACVGPYIYHLTFDPLVSVIPFILVLTFASVRPCVCLFLWPS